MVTILKHAALTALAAGALVTGGLGAGTAAAATTDQAVTPAAQAASWHPRGEEFCERWEHRNNPQCRSWNRWHFDRDHRWHHDRWNFRWHRWDRDWR